MTENSSTPPVLKKCFSPKHAFIIAGFFLAGLLLGSLTVLFFSSGDTKKDDPDLLKKVASLSTENNQLKAAAAVQGQTKQTSSGITKEELDAVVAEHCSAKAVPVVTRPHRLATPPSTSQSQKGFVPTVVGGHTCTADDLATGKHEDFLSAAKNYRGIVVKTGQECKAAREQYKRDHPGSRVVSDDA